MTLPEIFCQGAQQIGFLLFGELNAHVVDLTQLRARL